MDTLTHTMMGIAIARAGLAQRLGRGTTLVLAVASNLPDVDALWVWAGQGEAHLSRRLLTHSVAGLFLLAAVGATLFRWIYRHLAWRTLFGLCLLGVTVHVFFDLVNSYGVVLLYPFSQGRFELAWVFIIDLVLLGWLLVPAVFGPLLKRWVQPVRLWRASLVAVALYTGVCGLARWQADSILHAAAVAEGGGSEWRYVFPEALGPHRFRGVIREPDGGYRVYLIHVLSRRAEFRAEFRSDEQDPGIRPARTSAQGRKLEWFFQAPVWEWVEPPAHAVARSAPANGHRCAVYDLRFHSLVIDRGIPFRYEFRIQDGMAEPLGWQ
jgi:membrane-bound metal-dependent hydrolase YbcI (DUF457 family)